MSTHAPAAAHAKAFAAARLLRELTRDAHGNLAALGVAPLDDAAMAGELQQLTDDLAAAVARVAELRDRTGALAERHLAASAGRLKPNFGYAIATGRGVTRATTPG